MRCRSNGQFPARSPGRRRAITPGLFAVSKQRDDLLAAIICRPQVTRLCCVDRLYLKLYYIPSNFCRRFLCQSLNSATKLVDCFLLLSELWNCGLVLLIFFCRPAVFLWLLFSTSGESRCITFEQRNNCITVLVSHFKITFARGVPRLYGQGFSAPVNLHWFFCHSLTDSSAKLCRIFTIKFGNCGMCQSNTFRITFFFAF